MKRSGTASVLLIQLLLCTLVLGCSEEESAESAATPDTVEEGDRGETATEETAQKRLPAPAIPEPLSLRPQVIRLSETNHLMKEKEFILNVPEGYTITPAVEGLERVRFMALSPDGRLFATDMRDLSDNSRGIVWVFSGFDSTTGRFTEREAYIEGLRNPNNVAFHTDRSGTTWLYVGLTDRLVRYRYRAGSTSPASGAETLATFPDWGKSYREGGWHLTRTVAFGEEGKLYVSVGSSCNVCVEEEEVRASILRMNPDGSDQRIWATGLRNAVGLRSVEGLGLFATNMGSDHLGVDRPEDTFYRIVEGGVYGWPWAYEYQGEIIPDPGFGADSAAPPIESVEQAVVGFPAHSSPLGFDWFGADSPPPLRNTFLVALHGSSTVSMERGYSVVRVGADGLLGDFVNGFLVGTKRYGRPCDVLRFGEDTFLVSDDHAGVIYIVRKESSAKVED